MPASATRTPISENSTVDQSEIDHFSSLAKEWWDPTGKFKPLHKFNPVRLTYIREKLCEHFDRDSRAPNALSGLRILDIGGGAGETARKLIDLGHAVTIVVPSPLLAERCRTIAPEADVHECMFEDYAGGGEFDLCLFSESYQYIPLDEGVPRCLTLLKPEGHIIISDCFRSEKFQREGGAAVVGGGHPITTFRQKLGTWSVEVLNEEDITAATAPSVDIEQGLFNVLGSALGRVNSELEAKRPKSRWALDKIIKLFVNERARSRLDQRLNQSTRNRDVFSVNNTYLMMKLRRTG